MNDICSQGRKADHIDLARSAQMALRDPRFSYNPLSGIFPKASDRRHFSFAGLDLGRPWWISSMTGGENRALEINKSLALAARKWKIPFALGSCRPLLRSDKRLKDFDWREVIGPETPFFANIGIAQVSELLHKGEVPRLEELCHKLQTNGLIIHINPLQEWAQPEGDRWEGPASSLIKELVKATNTPLIVKEVGQGLGPKDLETLMQLPLMAIDLAGHGGTNFTKLEALRGHDIGELEKTYARMAQVGNSLDDMVTEIPFIAKKLGEKWKCKSFVFSGGVSDFLDAFYFLSKIKRSLPEAQAVIGQGFSLLKHAEKGHDHLDNYLSAQFQGLDMAESFLEIR